MSEQPSTTGCAPLGDGLTQRRVLAWLEEQGERHADLRAVSELFDANRDLFFQLAVFGVGATAPAWASRLASLAAKLPVAAAFLPEVITTAEGRFVRLDKDLVPVGAESFDVAGFFKRLRGVVKQEGAGKDYAGSEVGEAEVRFKLGLAETSEPNHQRAAERMTTRPHILRLDDLDRRAVEGGMPRYTVHGLMRSATKLVQAATVMYTGLRRDSELAEGRAYCGRLRYVYDNDARQFPAPPGMVYVVYVDKDNYVFDWDWARESPTHSGHILDPELRFAGDSISPAPEAAIIGVDNLRPTRFNPHNAWYSVRGDCVFCYVSDELAYADRINDDLTVFYSFRPARVPTGFKVKNIRRMLQEGRVRLDDAPDLTVEVDAFLYATFQRHGKGDMAVYRLLISALNTFWATTEPPVVRMPVSDVVAIAGTE